MDYSQRMMNPVEHRKGKGKGKAVDVEATLQRERERMVHERQEAVTRVLDEHDDLVRSLTCQIPITTGSAVLQIREAFHMEKFVTMLAYDPKACRVLNNDERYS